MIKACFIALIAILGAYAGSVNTDKWWRRYCIPFIIMLSALSILQNWLVITILSMIGFFSMGYGKPDPDYLENPAADEGSSLGRFWDRVVREDHVDMFVRGTVGLLVSLSMISIPILTQNWGQWLIGSLVVTSTYVVFGGIIEGEPAFKVGRYVILVEDLIIYATIGTVASYLIGV